ncbi:DUF1378 domain-containing protein, partial [Shigella dysenteriae]|nr:DUF1378 domain-containing protein [Shigella dysenteriae]EFW2376927.1 DUF1378 domain-containing protein [Shigella flexneri]EFY9110213.1 DUF1378 domain-containing protein [Shigella sonnei]EGE0563253.1 DUF1378 domain-containing protein [Shigella boydii]EFW0132359.1 DUF1378 domain-containing protein [Shigella dysenteriae]
SASQSAGAKTEAPLIPEQPS